MIAFACQNAQNTRYERVRQKLENRMFLAKPDFCKCIMDVRALMFEFNETELVSIQTDKPHQLPDLVRCFPLP